MAKNEQLPVTTLASAKHLCRASDYVSSNDLSPEEHQQRQRALNWLRDLAHSASKLKHTKTQGVLPRWRDGNSIDEVVAAALALWYDAPGTSYRITINFDHKYKSYRYQDIRDEVTRLLKRHGITHHCTAFEVSKKGRLHCHGVANLPEGTDIPALRHTLRTRFSKTFVLAHRAVHIGPVRYAPHERQGPEYWAGYMIGDEMLTKAELRWDTVYWVSRKLKEPAKNLYNQLRNPTFESLPFDPKDAPNVERARFIFPEASTSGTD